MAINSYRKPQDTSSGSNLGQTLGAVGTVVGGIAGSVIPGAGTMAGAGLGGAIGSTIGGVADASKPKDAPQAEPAMTAQNHDENAMSRRLSEMNNSPGVQIADANASMAKMPPEVQQEYGPALARANKLSNRMA